LKSGEAELHCIIEKIIEEKKNPPHDGQAVRGCKCTLRTICPV